MASTSFSARTGRVALVRAPAEAVERLRIAGGTPAPVSDHWVGQDVYINTGHAISPPPHDLTPHWAAIGCLLTTFCRAPQLTARTAERPARIRSMP